MLGIYVEGQTDHNDIYGAVYKTFGDLQSKYYPKDLSNVLEYTKAFDKSVLMEVVSSNPDLLKGKVNLPDYVNTKMTNKIGNKSYHIEFLTGSAEVTESSKSVLDQIYTDAVTADGTKLVIGGYTDNTGNPQANLELSGQRAQSVLNYIKSKGLGANRLSSQGHGQDNPIGDNNTAAGRSQNRRVEVTLLGK